MSTSAIINKNDRVRAHDMAMGAGVAQKYALCSALNMHT